MLNINIICIGKLKEIYLKDAITKTSCSLVDEEYVKGDKPGEGYCESKEEDSLNNEP